MKCFYHNDLDGRCAGSIVASYRSNYRTEDFIEVDYNKDIDTDSINNGEEVWFVDYSFTEKTMKVLEELLYKKCDIIWIDHHLSSIELVKRNPILKQIKGIISDKHSGAALTYMYCHNTDFDNIPHYVKLVSDYDCWKFDYEPSTTYFKLGVETEDFDALDSVWIELSHSNKINGGFYTELINTGEIVKKYIDKDNTFYRDSYSYETEVEGNKCLVVNKKTNSWVFGDKYDKYPIVMVWVFDGKGYNYSIYSSNKNINCSEIAEKYGGGGHKGAAGFRSKKLLFVPK